jgi:hypothetical protein
MEFVCVWKQTNQKPIQNYLFYIQFLLLYAGGTSAPKSTLKRSAKSNSANVRATGSTVVKSKQGSGNEDDSPWTDWREQPVNEVVDELFTEQTVNSNSSRKRSQRLRRKPNKYEEEDSNDSELV